MKIERRGLEELIEWKIGSERRYIEKWGEIEIGFRVRFMGGEEEASLSGKFGVLTLWVLELLLSFSGDYFSCNNSALKLHRGSGLLR